MIFISPLTMIVIIILSKFTNLMQGRLGTDIVSDCLNFSFADC